MDHLQQDDIVLGVRQRRKQADPISCPVCGITVRPADMEQHYAIEVERLHKFHSPNRTKRTSTGLPKEQVNPGCSTSIAQGAVASASPSSGAVTNGETTVDPKECWSTYQRIKNNRQARLKVKSRKRKSDETVCPVCNETTTDDINLHVEICLSRNGNGNAAGGHSEDDDESIDVEAESFEEYEWAGQTRIRASSLLQGGYGAVGLGTSIQNTSQTDEDEDLIVDGDDTQVFGESQYSERDVIIPSAPTNREQNENLYLRKLVVGQDFHEASRTSADDHNTSDHLMDTTESPASHPTLATASSMDLTRCSKDQIIDSLKAKIREFESQRQHNKCKCLICMDEFRIPVVSICCWHVHCEECWLRTLGARKLCPQCNMITSPTDLRRIYM